MLRKFQFHEKIKAKAKNVFGAASDIFDFISHRVFICHRFGMLSETSKLVEKRFTRDPKYFI